MCTPACASKGDLEMLCAENKAEELSRLGQNPRNPRDPETVPGFGRILHQHGFGSRWDVTTQGSDVLGSFGTARPSLEHLEEVANGPLALTQCCSDARVSRDTQSRGRCHRNEAVQLPEPLRLVSTWRK